MKVVFFYILILLSLYSCDTVSNFVEEVESVNVEEKFKNYTLCDDIQITSVKLNRNLMDNERVIHPVLKGTATINYEVERNIEFYPNENGDYEWTLTSETQESLKKRFLTLLISNSFSKGLYDQEIEFNEIKFLDNGNGTYEARDGDMYEFNYSIENVTEESSENNIPQNGNCSEIKALIFEGNTFDSKFYMSNKRFSFEGRIRFFPDDKRLKVNGKITNSENSQFQDYEFEVYQNE